SRAVDVAEIVRNRFMTDLEVGSIDICTEEMTSREGSNSNVSAIEIQLCKTV
ncbi:MAG: RNA-binding protein, partial [Methanobacterium sp.]